MTGQPQETTMNINFLGIGFDSPNAEVIAQFWAHVLGRKVTEGASADFAAVAADDLALAGPLLMFHKVPEGKTAKNRLHLDLSTSDFESESARIVALGASKLRDIKADDGRTQWTTFADPDGNEFDLVNRRD
jgi:predicted enzyme related to lactoylglutathione lyase